MAPEAVGDLSEERVARFSRLLLPVARLWRDLADVDGHAEFVTQRLHERRVGVRVLAQPVVHVRTDGRDAQRVQRAPEDGRVHAARGADDDGAASGEEASEGGLEAGAEHAARSGLCRQRPYSASRRKSGAARGTPRAT